MNLSKAPLKTAWPREGRDLGRNEP